MWRPVRANSESIKALRERSGMSSAHVARETGIDPTAFWRIENGQRRGTAAQLVAIAAVLQVPITAISLPDVEREVA